MNLRLEETLISFIWSHSQHDKEGRIREINIALYDATSREIT